MTITHLPTLEAWNILGYKHLLSNLTERAHNSKGASGKRLAAVITRGPIALGYGLNSYKTHPLQKKFATTEHNLFLHAEVECLARSSRMSLGYLVGATAYVVRVSSKGELRMAKPCIGCTRALVSFGIKQVYHT